VKDRRRDARLRALESRVTPVETTPGRERWTEAQALKYRNDPAGMAADLFGWHSARCRSDQREYQADVLRSLAECARVVWPGPHGLGKSVTCALALIWWTLTRPGSRAVCVTPQFTRQGRAIVLAAVAKLLKRARLDLPVELRADGIRVKGFVLGEAGATIVPSHDAVKVEGVHSEQGVLVVCDEARGVPQVVLDGLAGALTSEADSKVLLCGVPGGAIGPLYRAASDRSGLWRLHWGPPAWESSLVSLRWVEDRKREWGEGSPVYQSRVLGKFVDAGAETLFPLSLLEAAERAPTVTGGPYVIGIDVARSIAGDANALAVVQEVGQGDSRVVKVVRWHGPDLMQSVARVVAELDGLAPLKAVFVDAGGVGAGLYDRLRQLGYPVEATFFGGRAVEPERFKNRRAELFFGLRHRLERRELILPADELLLADLSMTTGRIAQDGRYQLDPKDQIRARTGRSPDTADAVALACSLVAERDRADESYLFNANTGQRITLVRGADGRYAPVPVYGPGPRASALLPLGAPTPHPVSVLGEPLRPRRPREPVYVPNKRFPAPGE
jgi:hypothetical protein